jgi:hypothetical protein
MLVWITGQQKKNTVLILYLSPANDIWQQQNAYSAYGFFRFSVISFWRAHLPLMTETDPASETLYTLNISQTLDND